MAGLGTNLVLVVARKIKARAMGYPCRALAPNQGTSLPIHTSAKILTQDTSYPRHLPKILTQDTSFTQATR